ncbi:MAG: hypothetical protein U7127_05150 [Phormidium sp.]
MEFQTEVVFSGVNNTKASPPYEKPSNYWDNWDCRALWGQPLRKTIGSPPGTATATRYPYPHGQIYPR